MIIDQDVVDDYSSAVPVQHLNTVLCS